MRRFAAMIGGLALAGASAACATKPGEPVSAQNDEALFITMIDAGRTGIFVDRIRQAAELFEGPLTGGDEAIAISKGLRATTLDFLATKESLCSDLKFVEQSCVAMRPPSWLAEDPTKPVTTAELARRVEQVQIMMGPLIDVACEYGKQKSGDGLFCSVE